MAVRSLAECTATSTRPASSASSSSLDEDPSLADLGERTPAVEISRGRDRHKRNAHLWVGGSNCVGSALSLCERETTPSGSEPKQHVSCAAQAR